MDDAQRATVAICLTGAVVLGLGSFIYFDQKDQERLRAKAIRENEIATCSRAVKDARGLSLVLTNKIVKTALECAEKHPEFRAFKDLYDERSPDSALRKPYDPRYWPEFP
jgi:hypothetical protein